VHVRVSWRSPFTILLQSPIPLLALQLLPNSQEKLVLAEIRIVDPEFVPVRLELSYLRIIKDDQSSSMPDLVVSPTRICRTRPEAVASIEPI